MNEQLKKRLTGAVVLIALAVIFIPMLLDRGSGSGIPSFGTNVPAKPDEAFQTIEVPLQAPPPSSEETRPITSEKDASSYEAQDKAEQALGDGVKVTPLPRAVTAEPEPIIAPEKRSTVVSAPVAPKPVAKPGTAPSPKAEEVKPRAPKPIPPGWAVQLGSFAKPGNALTLRAQLRAKGFAAFVEQQKSAGGVTYRVRVGPELKRENADLLKARLSKAGFKGVVMSHP